MSYFMGDTVRLTAEFKDWSGNYGDPTAVTVNIYERSNVIETGTATRTDTGKYYYDYEIPVSKNASPLVYEFSGELSGDTILGRKTLTRKFV